MQTLRKAIGLASLLILGSTVQAQGRRDRINSAIDDRATVTASGDLHPLAQARFDTGSANASERLDRMILVLNPDQSQQGELDRLLQSQQDPSSAQYHQWLTPESFGQQFGVSDSDLSQITNWLSGHGFQVEEVAAGRRAIMFSGTVGQVENTFHTRMRYFNVNGERHLANASAIAIPAALAGVVRGVSSLHDFRKVPMHSIVEFTSGSAHYMAPADFAVIYDVTPLYSSSFDGTGQSLAIVGRTNIAVSDVSTFRSAMGLPVNNPTIVLNGTDPGIVSSGEETEALLDVEWSGAVAKKAAVQLVVSASTRTTDGVDLSAQYIVNHNLAPVLSVSFGSCEAAMGPSENAFWNSLWAQAAAQGITAFVSAGDSGAAGCNAPSSSTGTGAAVSGLCSTPYNVCVGGTQFNDTTTASQFWSTANNASTYGSALSYIPENPWNESGSVSGGSGLWSGGGGVSTIYAKPAWQAGRGVPNDSHRDVPDVSLTAAAHDAYLIVMGGKLGAVSGTSASSPSFAGIMTLINQKTSARQGNANPIFYSLATQQAAGGAAVFHDTTSGNNSVPGVIGFTAGAGYDAVTGLGSVDALLLANTWQAPVATPRFSLTASPASITLTPGSNGTTQITSAVVSGFNAAVSLSISGLPAGVTANLSPAGFLAPGNGSSVLTLIASANAAAGTYSFTVNGSSNTSTSATSVSVTISPAQTSPPSLTLAVSSFTLSVSTGASASVGISVSGKPGAPVSLSTSGLAAGVSAAFSPASLATPGVGTSVLTFTVSPAAALSTTPITITASGGGITKSQTLSLTISRPFTATISTGAASVKIGSFTTATLTVNIANGFNSAVNLAATGLPAGVTCTFSPASFSGFGNQSSTVKFAASPNALAGKSIITLSVSGGGTTLVGSFALTVTK